MQVYVETAILENFCMDFTLLYSAKAIVKNPCGIFRLAISSALGACFAVIFPLMRLSGAVAVAVKLASGFALCAVAGRYNSVKGYVKFAVCFFALSFALGGLLLGIFSLADIKYEEGGGFLISSVPVGIPIFLALVLASAAKKAASRIISRHAKNAVDCRIYLGEYSVSCSGFYDSGNRVYYSGQPVSVIPYELAEKLIEVNGIKTFASIHTVTGNKKMAVFTADKIEIDDGEKNTFHLKVKIGVAPNRINRIVLHPDLAEVN